MMMNYDGGSRVFSSESSCRAAATALALLPQLCRPPLTRQVVEEVLHGVHGVDGGGVVAEVDAAHGGGHLPLQRHLHKLRRRAVVSGT